MSILKNRKIILSLIFLSVVVAGYYAFRKGPDTPVETPFLVEAVRVEQGDVTKVVNLVARVKPKHEALFISNQEGRLKDIYIEEGQTVSKGTLLAELENDEVARQLTYAQEKLKLAQSHHARLQKLSESKSQSRASIERAYDAVLQSQIEVERALKNMSNTQFIMPFDGVCGVFRARPGKTIRAGDQIVACYDISQFALDIDVPDSLASLIESGQTITFKDKTGQIASVQRFLDRQTKMGIARADVSKDWPVSLGQLISIEVNVQTKSDVLSLPLSAVFLQGKISFVYVIEEGKAALKPVTTGLAGRESVEITSGIEKGDLVVLGGQEHIWPTRALKVSDE